MATTIQIKRSTGSAAPATTDLVEAELGTLKIDQAVVQPLSSILVLLTQVGRK